MIEVLPSPPNSVGIRPKINEVEGRRRWRRRFALRNGLFHTPTRINSELFFLTYLDTPAIHLLTFQQTTILDQINDDSDHKRDKRWVETNRKRRSAEQ